jgi:hypothetical protein
MKTNKFGQMQLKLLSDLQVAGKRGRSMVDLYKVAFPANEYTFSFLTPLIVRMEHRRIVKVNWKSGIVTTCGGKYVERALADYAKKHNP